MKKYELVNETRINAFFGTLYRIRALRDFGNVKKGDLGGYVQSEDNLAHEGDCWVGDNAKIYGNARVFGDAQVLREAIVSGDARVYGNAEILGHAHIFGSAEVFGNAIVGNYACVSGNSRVFGTACVYSTAYIRDEEVTNGYRGY